MLKISFSEIPTEEKWILEGRLTEPWVRELRTSWKRNHRTAKERACIVDLKEITFVDKSGERLLRAMVRQGARCIATGVFIKHVLEQLTTKGKGSVLNRLTGFFFAAVVAVFGVLIGAAKEKLLAADARQPNDKNIKVLADTQAGLLAKLIVANSRMQSEIYKLLTPEQQEKLDYLKRSNEPATIVASAK
jgi:hypothetical protein